MDEIKYNMAVNITNAMILEYHKKLSKAIKDENWGRAGNLEQFIKGMEQTLTIFETTK